jgi:DNA-binding transcriptional regulator YiaG
MTGNDEPANEESADPRFRSRLSVPALRAGERARHRGAGAHLYVVPPGGKAAANGPSWLVATANAVSGGVDPRGPARLLTPVQEFRSDRRSLRENARATELRLAALGMVRSRSYTPRSVETAPPLTGNLIHDVRKICALRNSDIGELVGVSASTVSSWAKLGRPKNSAQVRLVEIVRTIGLTLVGGLGPAGVRLWLTGGSPSRLRRLRSGDVERVAAEARSYEG